MKLGVKIFICFFAACEAFSFLLEIESHLEITNWTSFGVAAILSLCGLLISIIVVIIIHIKKSDVKRRIFVYANHADFLIKKWAYMPKTAIQSHTIDFDEADDEQRKNMAKKRSTIRNAITRISILTIAFSGIYALFFFASPKDERFGLMLMASIFLLIGLFGILCIFIFIYLFDRIDSPIIDRDKYNFIKRFDELDDSIKITDHKVYKKEMYFEVSINKSRTYFLLTKKKLYYITYTDESLRKKNDFIKNNNGLGIKNAFITLFNNTNILNMDIADKDIDYIMTEVRNITIKVEN